VLLIKKIVEPKSCEGFKPIELFALHWKICMLLWALKHVPTPLFPMAYLCTSHVMTWESQLLHLKIGGMLNFQLPLPMNTNVVC
jgi:hypothetical protein